MAHEQDGEQAPAPVLAEAGVCGSHDLVRSVPGPGGPGESESVTTVLVALGANVLVAMAKSVAAMVTGSASILAEAAHSWADAGNEVFLLVASRRSRRPPDLAHPFGHGREAYVWSLFAALGLFVAGAAVSVTHGVQELLSPKPASHIAAAGLAARQLTGSPIPDAAGSVLVGALLGITAIVLINRNRQFLIGQEADPR